MYTRSNNPAADAGEDLKKALLTAGKTHKNVLILVGGDWSYSSIVFDRQLAMGSLKPYIDEHYVFLRVNFSPENKNENVLGPYDYPKHEGYPIIIVLDSGGKKIATKSCDEYKNGQQLPYVEYKILQTLKAWEIAGAKS